ncbi:unnamed protein product [Leptosia nina]|uniref:Gag-like protein n=1 Tax=Leptosia nina TaxID=320188 RepID=A0AAV1JAG0_9NEOP
MVLIQRTVCEETRVLSAENQRLREKLEELTRKVENLQKSSGSPNIEELEASLLRKLGDKMNARLEGLEPRLNPAPLLRPPLAADRRRKGKETVALAPVATVVAPGPKEKKKDKEDPRPPNPDSLEETWATVVKRKKSKEKSHPQPQPGKATKAKKSPKAKAKPKLRTPRSSAIVLTLTDEGKEKAMLTYQKALLIARSKIDLKEITGLETLRVRKAATGATVLELPGANSGSKADALAEKLGTLFGGKMKVTRPAKTVDIRISGIDESVGELELQDAVAKKGGCQFNDVKIGQKRDDRGSYGDIGRRRPRRRYARASCATSALGSGLGKGLADTSPLTEQSSGRRALGWFSG